MNQREAANLGYGKLGQSFPIGGDGYFIADFVGTGVVGATNVSANFVLTNFSGWSDQPFGQIVTAVNGTVGDSSGQAPHFWTATSLGQIGIHQKDGGTKWHVLTTVWETEFNGAENFTATLTSSVDSSTASYTINETFGYRHTLQFRFRGDVVLSMTPSAGNNGGLAMLFLDDVNVATPGGGGGGSGAGQTFGPIGPTLLRKSA
jgi:hypothetical protein